MPARYRGVPIAVFRSSQPESFRYLLRAGRQGYSIGEMATFRQLEPVRSGQRKRTNPGAQNLTD